MPRECRTRSFGRMTDEIRLLPRITLGATRSGRSRAGRIEPDWLPRGLAFPGAKRIGRRDSSTGSHADLDSVAVRPGVRGILRKAEKSEPAIALADGFFTKSARCSGPTDPLPSEVRTDTRTGHDSLDRPSLAGRPDQDHNTCRVSGGGRP